MPDLREQADLAIAFAKLELLELSKGERQLHQCPGLIELGNFCLVSKKIQEDNAKREKQL